MTTVAAAVVFDTNAYQGLGNEFLEPLLVAENRDDVLAHADAWVMTELLSKLADPGTRAYGRAAVRKLYHHCGEERLRIVVECEEQVCRLLTGKAPVGHDQTREALGRLTVRIATAKADDNLDDVLPAAAELQKHLTTVELDRAQTVLDNFIRLAVPSADSWDAIVKNRGVQRQVLEWLDRGDAFKAIAASEVLRAHKDVGDRLPDPIPSKEIDFLIEQFRYPLEVEVAVLRGVAERGWKLTGGGRQNSIWDAQVAFNANQSVGGRPVVLVTDDRLLLDVAARIGQVGVLRLTDYLQARGLR